MTDCDALLAAVRAEPGEDTPRLVFADWLDENGESAGKPWSIAPPLRASVIRAQVEHGRNEPHGPEARQAAAIADKMLRSFKVRWSQHLPRAVIGCEFVRGFIESVNVDAAKFPAVAEDVFETEPVRAIRVTRFRTAAGRVPLDSLLALPELMRIEELDLPAQDLADAELRTIFRSVSLSSLRRLGLRRSAITTKAFVGCLERAKLPRLSALDLADNTQFANGLTRCWPQLGHRRFTSLDFSRIPLTHFDVAAMVEAACTEGLEELRLAAPPNVPAGGSEMAAAIAGSPNLHNLRVLDLSGMMIHDPGAKLLARSPYLTNLRVLNLAANGVGTSTVKALLKDAPWELFSLNLRYNATGFSDLAALRKRFPNAVVEV